MKNYSENILHSLIIEKQCITSRINISQSSINSFLNVRQNTKTLENKAKVKP